MRFFSVENYLRIISGQNRTPRAALLRLGLWPAGALYAAAMVLRNKAYDWRWLRTEQVEVPVISVGNLTLGGTGKTPFVAWLARWFRRHGVRVSIVSRGYGAEKGSRNDEAKALEWALPDVPHLQNPDRVAAARTAITELETELILLDDAFQHRRIARDLDIVLLDALQPFGFGHVVPRGLLREPLRGIRRAQIVILSRADLVSQDLREEIRQRVAKLHPSAIWAEIRQQPTAWVNAAGDAQTLESFHPDKVLAFCGIGNPEAFRRTLERLQFTLDPGAVRVFPDHHPYTREDVGDLTRWAEQMQAKAVVCTEKDLVKIGLTHLGKIPLWALRIEVAFISGLSDVEAALQPLVERVVRNRENG
ncbi:MAG: tetraacyldisaccharide 4'-kinase [Thermogutta sp.]